MMSNDERELETGPHHDIPENDQPAEFSTETAMSMMLAEMRGYFKKAAQDSLDLRAEIKAGQEANRVTIHELRNDLLRMNANLELLNNQLRVSRTDVESLRSEVHAMRMRLDELEARSHQ